MEFKSIEDAPIKTLDDLINYETFFDFEKFVISDNFETLFDTYFTHYVRPKIVKIKTHPSHKIYNYNPKLFAKKYYGTPNLDWVILKINNTIPSRFILDNYINVLSKEHLMEIFNFLAIKKNSKELEDYSSKG